MNTLRCPWLIAFSLFSALLAAQTDQDYPSAPNLKGSTRVEQHQEWLPHGSHIQIENRNGDLTIACWEREEVALTASIRDSARRKVEIVYARPSKMDVSISVLFVRPALDLEPGVVQSPRCDMAVFVPRKLMGFFRTVNGSILVSSLQGYAHCETINGDVTIRDGSGAVHVDSINGNITLMRLNARASGRTQNGNILLEDVSGGLELETSNGDIDAKGLNGWGEGIRLETSNGSINLELGQASGYVSAESDIGKLDIKIPGAKVVKANKNQAQIRVPGRHQRILLGAVNGSIRIR